LNGFKRFSVYKSLKEFDVIEVGESLRCDGVAHLVNMEEMSELLGKEYRWNLDCLFLLSAIIPSSSSSSLDSRIIFSNFNIFLSNRIIFIYSVINCNGLWD
jgi:hypothetical protein